MQCFRLIQEDDFNITVIRLILVSLVKLYTQNQEGLGRIKAVATKNVSLRTGISNGLNTQLLLSIRVCRCFNYFLNRYNFKLFKKKVTVLSSDINASFYLIQLKMH